MGFYGTIYKLTSIAAAAYIATSIMVPSLELPHVTFALGWLVGAVVIYSELIKEANI